MSGFTRPSKAAPGETPTVPGRSAATKAYSYARFSTPEQAEGDSEQRQIDAAEAYCRRHGLKLDAKARMIDRGKSGYKGKNLTADSELGAFLAMLLDERDPALGEDDMVPTHSVLIVEELDRIGRLGIKRTQRIVERIIDNGCDVVTLADGMRYTQNMGITEYIILAVKADLAYQESKKKSQRIAHSWSSKTERARGGETRTRVTPGWIRVTDDGKRLLIPDRAKVVRRIFSLFLAGSGVEAIAQTLNGEKVPPFGRAQHWQRSYIHKILRNEAVIGTMTPHTDDGTTRTALEPMPGYYPAVLDPEVFERARALTETNRSRSKTSTVVRNVLAGLARCPACGGTMTRVFKGAPPKGGVYLVCAAAKVGAGCKYVAVRYWLVEVALVRTARDAIPDSDPDHAAHLESAEQTLAQLDRAIAKLVDSIERSPSKALTERLREREAERVRVAEDLEEMQRRAAESETRTLRRRKLALRTALTAKPFDAAAANLALREMVSKVVVDYTRDSLRMHWRHDGESEITYGFGMVSTSEKHAENARMMRRSGGKFAGKK